MKAFEILTGFLVIGSLSFLNAQIDSSFSTVKIGNQLCMSQNLSVETFQNGDIIPEAKTNEEWERAFKTEKPAWCFYNNDSQYEAQLGKLYNWFAVNDPRGLASLGFHVPEKSEWDSLICALGGQKIAGSKLKNASGWPLNGNGTNESGFNGLPGGTRFYNGLFDNERKYGHWWTATPLPPFYAWQYYLICTDDGVGFYSLDFGKGAGMSVRFIAD